MRKGKQRTRVSNASFHKAVGFTLVIGQAFALMPVDGITAGGTERLRFRWRSLRVLYTVVFTATLFIPMYASIYDMATTEASIGRITPVIFFGNSITVHVLFLVLARNWPKLMDDWLQIDLTMKPYATLNFRLKTMTLTVLTLAIVEHVLSLINHFIEASQVISADQDIFEYFFVTIAFSQVFALITYSPWFGILMQIITFMSTFSWTYIDLFIMLMSTSLAVRFQQVADRIELFAKSVHVSDEASWRKLREDYGRLSLLCRSLNNHISSLVMLSFSSNLFFILVQLFHSLKRIESVTGKLYFFFSFGFLIGRAVCVCLYGAWIYDESQRPLLTLNTLPSNAYNVEINRLTQQINFDPIALTGKNFFSVTRGLILSIAGAIMTYELILIQYFGTNQKPTNCTAEKI